MTDIIKEAWEKADKKHYEKAVLKDEVDVVQMKDGKMVFFDKTTGKEIQIKFCTICGGKGERHNDMHDSPDTCSNCLQCRLQGYPVGTVPAKKHAKEKNMIEKCHGCGTEKDRTKLEVYPYPEDDAMDCSEPGDPLVYVTCEPIEGFNRGDTWREALTCYECFHKLAPDMWIDKSEWDKLNPVTQYENLPLYVKPKS